MVSVQSVLRSTFSTHSNVVLFCFEKSKEPEGSFLFGTIIQKAFEEAKLDGFEGKVDQLAVVHPRAKELARVIFVGLGPKKDAQLENLRRAASTAVRKADQIGLTQLAFRPPILST